MLAPLRILIWAGTFAAAMAALFLCYLAGFTLTVRSQYLVAAYVLGSLLLLYVNGFSHDRHAPLLHLAECCFLFALMAVLGAILSYMGMVYSRGFTDDLLAGMDRTLGFDWPTIHQSVQSRPWLHRVLNTAYFSCFLMPFAVFGLLFHARLTQRMYHYLLAHGLALALTVIVFFFFPARAAFDFYLDSGTGIPNHAATYSAIISELRNGSLRTLDLTNLGGIITFPSFHASMAILFVWGAWPSERFRAPMMIVNALMWLAAVPIGGHYVVDLLGGSLIALVAIVATNAVAGRDRFPNAARAGYAYSRGKEATVKPLRSSSSPP